MPTNDPYFANQFHLTKNNGILSSEIAFQSNIKVWWICKEDREWKASICSRTRGGIGNQKCKKNNANNRE